MNIQKYLRYSVVFLTIELMITFVVSLLNLIGINSGITSIVLLVLNIMTFLILSFYNGKSSDKKGYLSGLILSLIFIIIMFLLNGFMNGFLLRLSTIIYYIILIVVSIIGGTIGINKKVEN